MGFITKLARFASVAAPIISVATAGIEAYKAYKSAKAENPDFDEEFTEDVKEAARSALKFVARGVKIVSEYKDELISAIEYLVEMVGKKKRRKYGSA